MEETWAAVDRFFDEGVVRQSAELGAAVEASRAAGLPDIQVAPSQGKLLYLLARATGSRSVLEIGTLGGYSTMWLASALGDTGTVVTLEVDAHHAEVAARTLAAAGLGDRVDIRLGPALDTLSALGREGAGPFDIVFIDADKENTAEYFQRALTLCRVGSLIVVDNVVRNGQILDTSADDPRAQGMRRFSEALAAEERVSATVVQTVGVKGYDGFALALVTRL